MRLLRFASSTHKPFCSKVSPDTTLCGGLGSKYQVTDAAKDIVQELCVNRGGRPGLSILTSLLVSVDVKLF